MRDIPPRAHTPRSDRATLGGRVDLLARAKGRPSMPWQSLAAAVALEQDPATGLPWYHTVVVSVPRQSGKTKLEGDVADHACLSIPRARVWLTMQTGKDAGAWMRDEHFDDVESLTPSTRPGHRGRWKRDRRAGAEGVVWNHGSTFRVFAPTRDGLHSKQADKVFVDEAWAHSRERGAEIRQAVRPTMATRPGSQLWIVSTRGDDQSEYLNDYLDAADAALADPLARICLVDYGLADGDDPDDLDAVMARHPAAGHTQTRESFAAAYQDFMTDPQKGRDEWIRAYGNRATRARRSAIPGNVWTEAGADALDVVPDRAGIAFDVDQAGDQDGAVAAIAGAWRDPVGRPHVRVLGPVGPPTRQLPEQLAALSRTRQSPIGYDPTGPGVLEVADAIARAHPDVTLQPQSSAQYASACGVFARAAFDRSLRHAAQPDLDAAVEVAVQRNMLDGGFGWHRNGSAGSIAALVAVTVALRVADTMPAPLAKPVVRVRG